MDSFVPFDSAFRQIPQQFLTYNSSEENSQLAYNYDVFPSHLAAALQPWSSQTQHSYHPPSLLAPLNISVPDTTSLYSSDVPIHAPIPRSHEIFPDSYNVVNHQASPVRQLTPLPCNVDADSASRPTFPQQPSLLDDYPQLMFPTPSELLNDLATQDDAAAHTREENDSETKYETQRKARQRALAESVGFTPTDPDTISSHEKKRHYLECIEHYIMYLHEQLRLVGTEPVVLERVSTYRGLSSRSIRTLLVHMENSVRKLHQQTLTEEQVFLNLRSQVVSAQDAQQVATAAQEFRRHSVATCIETNSAPYVS